MFFCTSWRKSKIKIWPQWFRTKSFIESKLWWLAVIVFDDETKEANNENDENKRVVTWMKIIWNWQTSALGKVYILSWWFSFRNMFRWKITKDSRSFEQYPPSKFIPTNLKWNFGKPEVLTTTWVLKFLRFDSEIFKEVSLEVNKICWKIVKISCKKLLEEH